MNTTKNHFFIVYSLNKNSNSRISNNRITNFKANNLEAKFCVKKYHNILCAEFISKYFSDLLIKYDEN